MPSRRSAILHVMFNDDVFKLGLEDHKKTIANFYFKRELHMLGSEIEFCTSLLIRFYYIRMPVPFVLLILIHSLHCVTFVALLAFLSPSFLRYFLQEPTFL